MDFDAFVLDKKTVYAINRALEIIGEASKQIHVLIWCYYFDQRLPEYASMRDAMREIIKSQEIA